MPRWIGLLGSWALLVLGLGLAAFAAAGEYINLRDAKRLERLETVDRLIEERSKTRLQSWQSTVSERESQVTGLKTKVTTAQQLIEERQDSDQTILVSTAENRVYLKRGDATVFEAICSTGTGKTLIDGGRTMVFSTPIGKFKILSKEENPKWVPPDWHYVEEARKRGTRVIRLQPGQSIDADTGGPVRAADAGVWSWVGESSGSSRVMKARGSEVVIIQNGVESPLPPGAVFTAGGAVVIPPIGTSQRKFDKVLGTRRLNLGDGYALHGTQAVAQLGTSASHGCVRLADKDIEYLYEIANVGDEVIIY